MDSRVAINASIMGDGPTGLGIYTMHLVRSLVRVRDDIAVVTSDPRPFESAGVRVIQIPAMVRPELGMRGHLARMLFSQLCWPLLARRHRFSAIVHTVPEAALFTSVPQVTMIHDLLPLMFPREYPRQQHFFRHIVPRGLANSRAVAALSETTRDDVVKHYGIAPSKVSVVYPGYDGAAFYPDGQGQRSPPYVLYVGNLLPHKNVSGLLLAFAVVRRRISCRLVLRGEGPARHVAFLRDRISGLGLTDDVDIFPYADDSGLRRLYSDASCFVLPSLAEGFGLTVLEAMACGTPVITSTAPALAEVGGDATLQADGDNVDGLGHAMYRLLTDVRLRDDLRKRGLQRVKQFSWHTTAEKVSHLVDGAIADR